MSSAPSPPTLRQLRLRAKLSPADIERLTGGHVRKGALSAIEQGKVSNPRADTLSHLAQVLGVDMHVCHAAIAATVAARSEGTLRPARKGRPPAPVITLGTVIQTARQLLARLEELERTA